MGRFRFADEDGSCVWPVHGFFLLFPCWGCFGTQPLAGLPGARVGSDPWRRGPGAGLDEHEWGAVDDRGDLGAMADQGGHEPQRVAGQRAAGAAAGDGDREGLGALVVGTGAAARPAAGRVEGLVEDLRGPALADRGQVDRVDRQRVGGAGTAQGAAGLLGFLLDDRKDLPLA